MIDIPVDALQELPVDQVGLAVLQDLADTNEWNEHNYLQSARSQYTGDALNRIAEAMAWLRARALIARKPGQTSADAIFITRTGRRVLADGPLAFYATERLQGGYTKRSKERRGPSSSSGSTNSESLLP